MIRTAVTLLALAASINAAPFHKQQKRQNGVVYNCNHDFAYTWDDGPYIYHNEILDHFDGVGKKTTFFMNGDNWSCIYDNDNVQAIRRSYEEGHQVASHTWSHADLTTLSHAQIDVEIQRLDQAFVNILGVKPRFLRPPYGNINDATASYIQNTHGKIIVNWSDDSTDSVGGSVQDSVNFYNNLANENPKRPHICLSHETEPSGIGALEQGTVENLNSHGVNMMTVASCLDQSPYEVVTGVYGTPDSTWYCGGSWTPPPPTSSTRTSTTSSGGGTCVSQYTSLAGDTCTTIGNKFGLSAAAILAANSFLNCNDIWTNTPICIPPGGSTSTSTRTSTSTTRTSTSTTSTAPTCVTTYYPSTATTCDAVGAIYGIPGSAVLTANSYVDCTDIWAGTPLCIPYTGTPTSTTTRTSTSTTTTRTSTSTSAAPSCVSTYTSVAGDSCDSIGSKYGLSGSQILAANTFLNCNDIWTNTPICIPPGGQQCSVQYYSKAGDNCDSIGSLYGVPGSQILAWNSYLTCSDIWVGTPIVICS